MAKSSGSIGLDEVSLISIFVEAILYGLFVFLFIASTTILLRKSNYSFSKINKPLLFASVAMIIAGTAHIAIMLRRILDAFIYGEGGELGPSGYLNKINAPLYLARSTIYAIQTWFGDAFIIYRLYLVWNSDKRVALPMAVFLLSNIAVGAGTLRAFARADPTQLVFVTQLQQWIVSFIAITFFTNFTCTILIALRIWWGQRQTKSIHVSGRSIGPAAVVIVESGAIYSVTLIILLATYLSGNNAQFIALDAVTQIIGIVFSLVIVRVALGISSDVAETIRSRATLFPSSGARSRESNTEGSYYGMSQLRVNVEVSKATDNVHEDDHSKVNRYEV
ncbi:hypothetical protein BDQ17DRAFT_1310457 [Cyathus striatus]|nr:hypothetical protein BDQ17DRAFT_1310457 [Cyathus striatus]